MDNSVSPTCGCQFKRLSTPGLIQVLNEHSYVMAVYNENTGAVRWHRVLQAGQKAAVEQSLSRHYPVKSRAK